MLEFQTAEWLLEQNEEELALKVRTMIIIGSIYRSSRSLQENIKKKHPMIHSVRVE